MSVINKDFERECFMFDGRSVTWADGGRNNRFEEDFIALCGSNYRKLITVLVELTERFVCGFRSERKKGERMR